MLSRNLVKFSQNILRGYNTGRIAGGDKKNGTSAGCDERFNFLRRRDPAIFLVEWGIYTLYEVVALFETCV